MKIKLNGEEISLGGSLDLQSLIETQGFADMKVAAAVNGIFAPKSQHAATMINDGDEIEIVAPMQGG